MHGIVESLKKLSLGHSLPYDDPYLQYFPCMVFVGSLKKLSSISELPGFLASKRKAAAPRGLFRTHTVTINGAAADLIKQSLAL